MSSEKGNVARRRPQRHQNARAFKNDKYDTSARLKLLSKEKEMVHNVFLEHLLSTYSCGNIIVL